MTTRGFLGFVIDGTEKIAYNHSDSYPSGLGLDTLGWLRGIVPAELSGLARDLRVVEPDSEPTDADVQQLQPYYNPNVGGRSARPTWYQLLRGTQGIPGAMLQAGVIEDASGFPTDSLFAEYGYVVDLDAGTFEAYQGFQREAHQAGRFADRRGSDGYYPVALVAFWPLDDLPSDEEFMQAVEPEGGAR